MNRRFPTRLPFDFRVGLFRLIRGAGEDAANECHRVLFVQREAGVALSANRHDRQVMWTWLCQKALGRNMILVRFEARERPRAVDAPRHLPFLDELFDLLHISHSFAGAIQDILRGLMALFSSARAEARGGWKGGVSKG